jgi:hypothetical protein
MDQADVCPAEDIESIVPMGCEVSVRQLYNGGVGQTQVESVSVFAGNVESIRTQINGKDTSIIVTARDFVACLERMTVFGRRCLDEVNRSVFDVEMQAVFNDGGVGNASRHEIGTNGKSYKVFDAADGRVWTYGEIINYLLGEYVVLGLIGVPSLEELEAVTGYVVADELNLEGKSVANAIEICCEKTGVEFAIEASYCSVGSDSDIVFYRPGKGRGVELNCQYAGNNFDISQTNIISIDSQRQLSEQTIVVATAILGMHYHVGDKVVCSPDSRDLLGIRRDKASELVIAGVTMDVDKQATSLEIVRRRDY